MGSGKTIWGVGITDIYDADPETFLANVSKTFHVNVKGILNDKNFDETEIVLQNGYAELITINVQLYEVEYGYEVHFPVIHKYEKTLDFSFYSNNLFSVMHLPFSAAWRFFIDEILGEGDEYLAGFDGFLKEKLDVRELYIPLLKKMNCSKMLVVSDVDYNWRNEFLYGNNYDAKYSFEDIQQAVHKLDKITLFDLKDTLNRKNNKEIQKIAAEDIFQIAFIDELE